MFDVLLQAALETSFGVGGGDSEESLLDGDEDALVLSGVRSRVLPLRCVISSLLLLSTLLLEGFLVFLVVFVTQTVLRHVERWNCAKWLQE